MAAAQEEKAMQLRTVFLAAVLSLTSYAAAAAEPVAVGIGGSSSDAPLYIAQQKGYFADEGLDVNLLVLDTGAKIIAPLATGELQVGSGALSVGFYNALERGVGIRIVADRGHTEKGYFYQSIFVRKDLVDSGAFKSLKDLKGLRMGFAAPGVTALSALNEACKFAGLAFTDVNTVFMSFPQIAVALQNKALDASMLIEPQATLLVHAGAGVRFMNSEEFYPSDQITVLFYSDKFAKEQPAVAQNFMKAWLRAVRVYNDALVGGKIAGPGKDEIVAVMDKAFKLPADVTTDMYSQAVDPNGEVIVPSIQKDLDFFRAQGWVKSDVKLADVVDMSFARKAAAELGPYHRKTP
jgi:NitT/TauT family transport system substrate-binding protein